MKSCHESGSDGHRKLSIEIKDAIKKRLARYEKLSTYQAMKIISRIPDDIFPADVQSELVDHINGMVDLDLDMDGAMDIGLLADANPIGFVRTQVCDWFHNYIPKRCWTALRQEGADIRFLTRILACICSAIHLYHPKQTTAGKIVAILHWLGQLNSREEHIAALHAFKSQLQQMYKHHRQTRELPSVYPERPSKFA